MIQHISLLMFVTVSSWPQLDSFSNKYKSYIPFSSLSLYMTPILSNQLQRPPTINIPRPRLRLPFAVKLMRSSYEIIDEMNICPMDEFQKDFFLFRQLEWEGYLQNHPKIIQGDLADANYLDFISYAQYATISNKFKFPLSQFVEKIGAEGELQVSRRNSSIDGISDLALFHSDELGSRLLDYFLEVYPDIAPRLPSSSRCSVAEYVSKAQQIVDLFAVNSYCLDPKITYEPIPSQDQAQLTILLRLPSTLWSQQLLRNRKDKPCNDFEVKVLKALARRCGWEFILEKSFVSNRIDLFHVVNIRS